MKMKSFMRRSGAAMLAAAMLSAAAAGCSRNENDEGGSLFEPPEYVYVAETIRLPDDMEDINSLIYANGRFYFATYGYIFDEESFNQQSYGSIYTVNIDGSGLTELTGYAPVSPIEAPQGASGGISINSICADNDGGIWVVEYSNYYNYNLPEGFDHERDADLLWDYYEDYGNGTVIRKLDETGAGMFAVNLADIAAGQDNLYVHAFHIDGPGNMYICVYNRMGSRDIYVLDPAGKLQFKLETDSWFNELIRLPDGRVAFPDEQYGENGYKRVLQPIDFSTKGFGEVIEIPELRWGEIYPGSAAADGKGGYDVLINEQNDTIYGYTIGEEKAEKLFSWLESDIIANDIQSIAMLPDGRVLCTARYYENLKDKSTVEILLLTKTPYSELPEKTIITLAGFYVPQNITQSVIRFNRENRQYRIQINDFSRFSAQDDYYAGLIRFSAEITTGTVPDIISISNIPYAEYAQKGLFADLYPLLDSDPEFGRGDFIEGAFRAAEIDGKLYQVFPSVTVQTIAGHPSVVWDSPGWTLDEFTGVLASHPDADMPLGQWLTKTNYLNASLAQSLHEFIDWEKGSVSFDSPEFVTLLETAGSFPDDIDWSSGGAPGSPAVQEWLEEDELVAKGRQIMAQVSLSGFPTYLYYKMLFDGAVAFKGFPSTSREGNSLSTDSALAISAQTKHKDAAWAFVRTILDADWQEENIWWGFPTNNKTFGISAEHAKLIGIEHSYHYNNFTLGPADDADIDAIRALIASARGAAGQDIDPGIMEIISESVTDFFAGAATAQDAARVIQSRVSILVSERSG